MLKKTRKINDIQPVAKKPAVLRVPIKSSQAPVVPKPPAKQWQYRYKSPLAKEPLIDSYLIRQKLRLMPSTLNWFKLTALALLFIVVGVPAMSAFEAHIVNVTAEVSNVDPPVLTPPGDSVAWDDTNGGTGLVGPIDVQMSDSDSDAVNIYYTFGAGTDPGIVSNPTCGGIGGDKSAPQHLVITSNTVIKAIACEVTNSFHSVINTKIYSFGENVDGLLINEFLPNPTGNASGNRGAANGHLNGNGGEWVELYNNSSSTIDVDGFVLYDKFVPTSTPASNTWTTNNDFNFNPAPTASGTIVNSGSVKLDTGVLTGTFEKVYDIGTNKKAVWNNLSMSTFQNDAANSVCASAATSNDGVNYSPYSNLLPCATQSTSSITSSLAPLAASRFIKWKTTHSRTSTSTLAFLDSLTINYDFTDYNTYHELVITGGNTDTGGTIIPPSGFLVVYRDGNASFELNTPSNQVKLYDGHIFNGAALIDSHAYDLEDPIPVNKSFARVPDGSSNWVDPCPTPGAPNVNEECGSKVLEPEPESSSLVEEVLDTPDDATTTPQSDATTTPENTEVNPDSKKPVSEAGPTETTPNGSEAPDNNQPETTGTPPEEPQDPPAAEAPKQDEAIVPPPQQQDQDVAPAPPTSGSGGDTPPPAPQDGPQATSTTLSE